MGKGGRPVRGDGEGDRTLKEQEKGGTEAEKCGNQGPLGQRALHGGGRAVFDKR